MVFKIIFKHLFLISVVLLTMQLVSCKKFVDVNAPETKIVAATVFIDNATATSAMVGVYSQMMFSSNTLFNGSMSAYGGMSSDELIRTSNSGNETPISTNSIPTNNAPISALWSIGYNTIYQTNAVIEGLEKSTAVTAGVKSQLVGEAKFVRALTYYYLSQLFGEVPLILTINYEANRIMPRTSVSKIYEQIIADLNEAKLMLPTMYVTNPSYPTDRTRPNKWTATALLARVYLYRKEWANAEAQSTEVISAGTYSLITNLAQVFLKGSNEAIWQLQAVSQFVNTGDGNIFNPPPIPGFAPTYALTSSLYNSFEVTDQRPANWLKKAVVGVNTYYYPYKYKVGSGGAPYSEYNVVLRLAEQYLIRAEARAQLNTNLSGAKSDLNMTRNRAGLLGTIAITQSEILAAIEQERRLEFIGEWGHRWFDLKRNNRANDVLSPIKVTNWQATDTLYPIPQVEILRNPYLSQNDGYQ